MVPVSMLCHITPRRPPVQPPEGADPKKGSNKVSAQPIAQIPSPQAPSYAPAPLAFWRPPLPNPELELQRQLIGAAPEIVAQNRIIGQNKWGTIGRNNEPVIRERLARWLKIPPKIPGRTPLHFRLARHKDKFRFRILL